jgi:hypothetical protein
VLPVTLSQMTRARSPPQHAASVPAGVHAKLFLETGSTLPRPELNPAGKYDSADVKVASKVSDVKSVSYEGAARP